MIRNIEWIRLGAAVAFSALVFSGAGGCQKSEPPAQPSVADTSVAVAPAARPIAVLYSYSPIGLEVKQSIQIQSDTVWAGREIFYSRGATPVVLANTGVGFANAAATAQYIIDRYNPKAMLLSGIAAAVNPAHHIGDLVIPGSFASWDYGYWGEHGLQTDSVSVGSPDSAGFARMLELPVDQELMTKLGAASDEAAFRLRAVGRRLPEIHRGGLGISGNSFLDNKAKREQLAKNLNAQITDTESAAVVQTCHAAGVPVAVIRACAAPSGESTTPQAQAELTDFFKVAAHNVALVILRFLEMEATM